MITGAGGLLGSALATVMGHRGIQYIALTKADLDVTDGCATEECIKADNPDVVFHCAAFTDVDRAEAEQKASFIVNADGASNVARACKTVGARMVFFSTDYVFDGAKRTPYSPDDKPNPLSTYGESKLAGESLVTASGVDVLLIRTSWLYGAVGRNLVDTVIQGARKGKTLQLVDDQIGSPTWAKHMAEITLDLVSHRVSGTYHVTDSGEASWYDLGREALSICGLQCEIKPISSEDWRAPAPRPRYSVLNSSNAEAILGRRMTPWRKALKRFLEEELK